MYFGYYVVEVGSDLGLQHTLEKEVVLSGLIILTALALKVHHFTVLIMDLDFTTASIDEDAGVQCACKSC